MLNVMITAVSIPWKTKDSALGWAARLRVWMGGKLTTPIANEKAQGNPTTTKTNNNNDNLSNETKNINNNNDES